jgi:type II secretory pathway pseudopilin PulG
LYEGREARRNAVAAGWSRHARGFTLLEALMAAAILFAGMLAVMSAIMTGQQNVFEAEFQLRGTVLAEEKMQNILKGDYYGIQPSYDELPWNSGTLARIVNVETHLKDFAGLGVLVNGKDVTVTVGYLAPADENLRTLAELKAFIPEPAS